MLKVWTATKSVEYEGNELLGIFATEEAAKRAVEKDRAFYGEGGYIPKDMSWDVEEVEVQE
jgi:hypothetical protein